MVQQHQYTRHPSEDPNEHIGIFLRMTNTVKLKICLMHGIDLTTQMDIFYHSMNCTSKGIIDVACCGAFKRKSVEEAKQLIEDLTKCNYTAPFETSGSSSKLKGSGGDRVEQDDCHRSKT